MPKHKERTASTRAVDPKSAKPYDHERQLVASVASLTPASSSKDVADSPAPASGSRRRKKRKRNVDTDVEPTEPDAVDEADAINGVSPAPLLPGVETPEQVLERHTAQYRADSLEKALAKERKLHEYALRALAETQSDLRTLQDAAERAEDTLKARIAALEASLNDVKAAEEKRSAEMDAHKQLITDQSNNHDSVKEDISCSVCCDILDDPHSLSCGHTACRDCLVQWFRSPNAYRNDDITEVAADDDLTYRTKVCYMCRVPALRRPIRNFAIQSVIHTLGLGSALDKVVDRNEDVWELTFPSDPTSYLISADDVHRCPICTAEVDLGECSHCSLTFSDIDGDEDFGDGDEDDENEAMAVLQNTVPRLPREPLLIDDEAEDDDPETDYGDDLYWGGVVAAIGEDTVDDMSDDMSDEMEGSFDGDSDDEGRSFASSPPPRARGERGGRRAGRGIPVLSQAVDENEDGEFYGSEGDDGYESSFIDDDENAVHLVGSDDDEEYSEDQVDATTAAIPSSDVSDDEFLDEPTVNDLRARRAARFAPHESSPPAATQPVRAPPRRNRRVIVVDSDDE